jgi:hypothetical protein
MYLYTVARMAYLLVDKKIRYIKMYRVDLGCDAANCAV